MHAEEESMGTQDDIVKQWAMMREGPLTGNTDNQRGKEKDKNWNRLTSLSLSYFPFLSLCIQWKHSKRFAMKYHGVL